ncbi:MAG TPA: exo-alpha-sialidase [Gammaproteobacteria bacterium]
MRLGCPRERRRTGRLGAWLRRLDRLPRPPRIAARLTIALGAGLAVAGAALGGDDVEAHDPSPSLAGPVSGGAQPSPHPRCGPDGPPSVHCGTTPTAAFDRSGRLWVAFAQRGHVHVASSDDAGRSFRAAVTVNSVAETLDVNGENRPKIAFGTRGEIYVSWTRRLPGGYNGDIRFSRSLDGGERFEPPITVNDDGLATGHRFESLAVDAEGNVYLAWLDKRDGGTASVYYTVSADAGATFAANRRVAAGSCECCRIAIAPSSGAVGAAIFWRHVFSGGVRDHALAVIGPGGVLAPPRRATHDGWRIDACPHHGPAMSVVGDGSYDLAWFSGGGARTGIAYGRYVRGSGLTRVRTMSTSAGASHPHLAAVGGSTLLVWKELDGERTRVLLAVTNDGGLEWSTPVSVASTLGASDHPFLATRGEEALLVWHTEDEGLRVVPLRGHASASPQTGETN